MRRQRALEKKVFELVLKEDFVHVVTVSLASLGPADSRRMHFALRLLSVVYRVLSAIYNVNE